MMLRPFQIAIAAAFLAACASDDYTPYAATPGSPVTPRKEYDQFTLERTACFGFCPIYKVSVDERDILIFEGERFVAEAGGAVSKRLPEGSFKKLVEIARAHQFASYDAAYPNEDGSNCPQQATDSPSVIVSIDSGRLKHAVSLYQGCMGFDGRERFNEMVLAMDAVLDIDPWIGPREDFYGAKE